MGKRKILLFGLCMLLLVGCGDEDDKLNSAFNSFIEKSVMGSSNIENEETYKRYEEISSKESVSAEGYYYSDDVDYNVLEDTDAIHVTFATNSFIDVTYFDDAAKTSMLDARGAYMHCNDCIYAEIIEIYNPNTEAYKFSGFEVWEFDEKGQKKELETELFEDGLVFQIPMEFRGKEISIIPLGEYVPRDIKLNDYYKDNNGIERTLAGTWDINGYTTTNSITSVSPVAPYAVTYKYDSNLYDFVSSEPECLYNNDVDGIVSFEEFSADQNVDCFCVELHKKSGDQEFDPSKYRVEHAEIEYKYQGVIIETPMFIPSDGKISYEIKKVDNGYWVPEGNEKGEIEVSSVAELIESIVWKEEKVKVMLPQPEKGGKVTYSMNGKEINNDFVEVFIGTEISMSFSCKNGWTCNAKDGSTYRVSNKEVQRVNVGGEDINNIFIEQQYKPHMILSIDKSVGIYTEFTVDTSEGNEANLKLAVENKSCDVFESEVGTKNDLVITASNGALLKGEALKFEIQKETVNGFKENDIRYLDKIPDSIKISLYIADSDAVYKNVQVKVSKVNVVAYANKSVVNGYVSVKTTDLTNNRYLRNGELIEESRKVVIAISAKEGYYVKNSGKTDVYSDTVKYSKYEADIDSIISKHPIKKLCKVTLDTTDPYGKVTFMIDGKTVSAGQYKLKEEQKLEIQYEITDGKHIISRKASNWAENLWDKSKNKFKETEEIAITSVLDGSVVTREKYINITNK